MRGLKVRLEKEVIVVPDIIIPDELVDKLADRIIVKLQEDRSRFAREEVRWFSEQMEAKLRENDHKQHWSELSDDYLIDRLYQEARELWMAIKHEPRENVIKEAADVANFAMMIADNYSNRRKNPSR